MLVYNIHNIHYTRIKICVSGAVWLEKKVGYTGCMWNGNGIICIINWMHENNHVETYYLSMWERNVQKNYVEVIFEKIIQKWCWKIRKYKTLLLHVCIIIIFSRSGLAYSNNMSRRDYSHAFNYTLNHELQTTFIQFSSFLHISLFLPGTFTRSLSLYSLCSILFLLFLSFFSKDFFLNIAELLRFFLCSFYAVCLSD